MGLWSDYESEAVFGRDYPHGVPCGVWTTASGKEIPLKEMETAHIKNCMRLIGEDDPWYGHFQKELKRRKEETKKLSDYQMGEWDMFELITSTWYGKQYYFIQKNGLVYSRLSHEYITREEAFTEFLEAIGE